MKNSSASVIAINGGSSSIKFAMFAVGHSFEIKKRGSINRIGLSKPVLQVEDPTGKILEKTEVSAPDFKSAATVLTSWMKKAHANERISAIGHRVVHGGPKFSHPQVLNREIVSELSGLGDFDPEHLPAELLLVSAIHGLFPEIPQVACFDTDFHHEMPTVARLLAIPRRFEKMGVRRYGFHGISYSYLIEELSRVEKESRASDKVILAHLGSGASLAAVKSGKSIDTSMGFTPASGIAMSTRSGDIDPGLGLYLERRENLKSKEFNDLLNFKSGLLGISETTSDMHDLLGLEGSDSRASEAVSLFCYQVKKCIGAYSAALGGLDTLVFSGGIGEKSAAIRARICDGLDFLGIEIDQKKNEANEPVISTDGGRAVVRMIRTDEEHMIAKIVGRVLNLS